MAAELDHQPDAVFALRREGHGAAAVEGWPAGGVRQETVLNPE
jgi:hypothetical protein